jgi:GNAT superfamily N-acetyltransferase
MRVIVRSAIAADMPLLAEMNRRLIEDEGSRNPMTAAELQQRMCAWWSDGWEIRLFVDEEQERVVGYALYQIRCDDYFPERKIIYLRQFYVERAMRLQGIGRGALTWLQENEWPADCTVVIDVLASNPLAHAFWKRMGFDTYYTDMRFEVS